MFAQKQQIVPDLPWIDDQRDLARPPMAARRPLPGAAPPEPNRLLVLDDNDIARATFADMLTRQGYDVTCVCSVAEATASLTQCPFDMMLCDIHMPGQNCMV